MPAHNLLSKCDRALAAWLISRGAGTAADVFPAKNSDNKAVLPCTVIWSERASEAAPFSGTYVITTQVQVRSLMALDVDQPPAEEAQRLISENRVGLTFDSFHFDVDSGTGDALADDITSAARSAAGNNSDLQEFTMENIRVVAITAGYDDQHGRLNHGSCWVDIIELESVCRPSRDSSGP